MLKSELIKQLISIEGDFEVTFPNFEYDGYEKIKKIEIKSVLPITEDGKRLCPETGTDFLDKDYNDKERLNELYENEKEQNIIVLNL